MQFSFGLNLSPGVSATVAKGLLELNGGGHATQEDILRQATPLDIAAAFSRWKNYPVLSSIPEIEETLVDRFGLTFLREMEGVPIKSPPGYVTWAVVNPCKFQLLDRCKQEFPDVVVQVVLLPFDQFSRWIGLRSGELSIEAPQDREAAIETGEEDAESETPSDTKGIIYCDQPTDSEAKGVLVSLLRQLVTKHASDLHLAVERERFYFEMRIDGDLIPDQPLDFRLYRKIDGILVPMAGGRLENRRTPISGEFTCVVNSRQIRMRYERHPMHGLRYGYHATVRNLDTSIAPVKIGEGGLVFPPVTQLWIDKLLSAPEGMIIITGPTGSGKSTTQQAMLRGINRSEYCIITAENPVEYILPGIKHVNISDRSEFNLYLQSYMRSDPDILVIGEIRDPDSADLAAEAANTGHLVFGTMHTRTPAMVADRFMDLKLERWRVADNLIGALGQRLVKCLCPACAIKDQPITPREMELYGLDSAWKDRTISRRNPEGCVQCDGRGYKGRRACLEVIPVTEKIRSVIAAQPGSSPLISRIAHEEMGLPNLRSLGLDLVEEGITDLEAVSDSIDLTLSASQIKSGT